MISHVFHRFNVSDIRNIHFQIHKKNPQQAKASIGIPYRYGVIILIIHPRHFHLQLIEHERRESQIMANTFPTSLCYRCMF
jgi:hypothetical protein